MKPIWYFVGLILLSMGSLVFLTGIYLLIDPSSRQTVLSGTHPNIWWGTIMILFGGIMFLKTKNQTV
jgi:hypothetical protein